MSSIPLSNPGSAQYALPEGFPCHTLKRPSRWNVLQDKWKKHGRDAFTTVLSALYGKLLTVMGIAFPMSEVISTHIPHSFYEVFYLYLYIGSMLFLFYIYLMLLGSRTKTINPDDENPLGEQQTTAVDSETTGENTIRDDCDNTSEYNSDVRVESLDNKLANLFQMKTMRTNLQPTQHYGSFYLRMGAVSFGIGSMIYSGLEIGQYFELERNTKCHNVLIAVTPATRMAFIFIQMYFIFLNEEQQVKVMKHTVFSRFGLMHMIGTNLSVWLNVLIQETKHEILTFYNPENNTIEFNTANHPYFKSLPNNQQSDDHLPYRSGRSVKGPHYIYDCRRTNIIGSLVQNASPFLFPCTIEYSLICAAILYVMWKNIGVGYPSDDDSNAGGVDSANNDRLHRPYKWPHYRRSPHHYSVDCAQAHKGLFVGILFLVLTIISLILFFVLVSRPELVRFAVMEVNICELALYSLTTIASVVGMIQIGDCLVWYDFTHVELYAARPMLAQALHVVLVRNLKFDRTRSLELDNILLLGAQTGVFVYSTFTIISGHFTKEKNTILVLITASISLIQTTCQTVFILDASRRSCVTLGQMKKKPGREIVTFLLVSNLAMWAINTLEKSRADSHPIQLHFYGLWAWTIITHVSMPLAIFYRFHSTVCLCEIWKKAYKTKHLLYV